MMNIPPDQAKKLSMWEYEALLFHWNEAHDTSDDLAAPDPEMVTSLIDRIAADPRLTQ